MVLFKNFACLKVLLAVW